MSGITGSRIDGTFPAEKELIFSKKHNFGTKIFAVAKYIDCAVIYIPL